MASIGFSQSEDTASLDSFTRLNLGLHGLEITNELPVSQNFVWENSIGLGMGSSKRGSDLNYTLYLEIPAPYITSELKFFIQS